MAILDPTGRPVDPYANADPVRKPAGVILVDGVQVADTLQCVHCGGHWIPQRGSGMIRGFCRNCMGPVCGPGCARCVPAERQLELIEQRGHGA